MSLDFAEPEKDLRRGRGFNIKNEMGGTKRELMTRLQKTSSSLFQMSVRAGLLATPFIEAYQVAKVIDPVQGMKAGMWIGFFGSFLFGSYGLYGLVTKNIDKRLRRKSCVKAVRGMVAACLLTPVVTAGFVGLPKARTALREMTHATRPSTIANAQGGDRKTTILLEAKLK